MKLDNLHDDDLVSSYKENGYGLSPKIFSDSKLENFREHHDRVVDGEYETTSRIQC